MASYSFKPLLLSLLTLLVVFMQGCSGSEGPDNLEPALKLLEAEEVTRTEATLRAEVEQRGPATLSFVQFVYSAEGSKSLETERLVPDGQGRVSVRLTGLRPGCTYTYYAVGGTSSASMHTRSLTFATAPNDKPKVSTARPLSTGPLSIIVEFEVTDDGGEPLTAAGCYLKEVATGSESRLELTAVDLTKGSHRLCISPLKVEHEYEITPFAANTSGETLGEPLRYTTRNSVVLEEAGELPLLFSGVDGEIDNLTVSGPMNGDDFHYLRLMLGAPALSGEEAARARVERVDLSDAVITAGGGPYDGQRYIEADVLSTGLFAGCTGLNGIVLPSTAVSMQRNALLDCSGLREITIPASVSEVVPSEGCSSLAAIRVSEANTVYASYEGVLYKAGLTEMVWFPQGKEDAFTLPPVVTEIGEGAFKNIPVKSLIIPESVTTIARGAFAGSQIEEIELPDGLTNVSESMFQDCSSLRVLRLGKSVNYMGSYALDGCPLEHLYIKAVDPPYAGASSFTDTGWDLFNNCTLHVPSASRARYRNHARWGKFIKILADD